MKRLRDSEDEDNTAGYGEDTVLIPVFKILNLDTRNESSPEARAIPCSLPGHAKDMSFTDYHEYEKHYVQAHTNRCLECGRNFPTSHIMGLHIQEHHDALAEMKREQGASTYMCFVEACEDRFKSYKQRKEHLIKDHAYPQNYFFAVTKFGIDRRQSMLVEHRHGKSSQHKDYRLERQNPHSHSVAPAGQSCGVGVSKDMPMTDAERSSKGEQEAVEDVPMIETGQTAEWQPARELTVSDAQNPSKTGPLGRQTTQNSAAIDAEMEGLTGAMSSLKFVPRAVRLGPKQNTRR